MPLAFRILEDMPGITATTLFAINRGSNTLMRGGFMDDRRRGPGKLGGFAKNADTPTRPTARAYSGTRRRQARMAAATGAETKMPFLKGARVNNVTARPRALSRFSSLTAFNAAEKTQFYSPFQFMAQAGGGLARKNQGFMKAVYESAGLAAPEKGEQIFQRGMVSMITAGRKLDLVERRAMKGSSRAQAKLNKAQDQVRRLALMNNPSLMTAAVPATPLAASARKIQALRNMAEMGSGPEAEMAKRKLAQITAASAGSPGGMVTRTIGTGMGAASTPLTAGLTGNLMASAGATVASRYTMGYFRGALGAIDAGGLTEDAMRGAQKAVSHFTTAFGVSEDLAKSALKVGGEGVFKTLRNADVGILKGLGTKQGAMVMGARTAAMAIPGLNLLATASLVYDLGKMGGEVIKSGIELTRDAVKSFKGSIDKPTFGMGYKDNEVAATSRARGVMAIQNSRLNARSLLGSERSDDGSTFWIEYEFIN